ncbi:MAG: hypothetical protein ACLRWP_00655 [Bilophila wadsworthia]
MRNNTGSSPFRTKGAFAFSRRFGQRNASRFHFFRGQPCPRLPPLSLYPRLHRIHDRILSCEPPEDLCFEDALARLEAAPLDEFCTAICCAASRPAPDEAAALRTPSRPVLMGLLYETAFLNAGHAGMLNGVSAGELERLEGATPLPYLSFARKSLTKEGQEEQANLAAWNALFEENLSRHHPLPHPDDNDLPLPAYVRNAEPPKHGRTAAEVHAERAVPGQPIWSRPPAQHTAAEALASLATCGVIAGTEMRHESSLAPVGLLRNWNVDIAVCNGKLDYTLQGKATTWGRGLSIATARASYSMEMVERASAYLSVDGDAITDRLHPTPIVRASHAELLAQGRAAIDPRGLPIDAEYNDQPLYWMEGRGVSTARYSSRCRPWGCSAISTSPLFSVAGFHGHGFGQHTR